MFLKMTQVTSLIFMKTQIIYYFIGEKSEFSIIFYSFSMPERVPEAFLRKTSKEIQEEFFLLKSMKNSENVYGWFYKYKKKCLEESFLKNPKESEASFEEICERIIRVTHIRGMVDISK